MQIKALHKNFQMPKRKLSSGGYDISMPESGSYIPGSKGLDYLIPLGFSAAIPEGHVAMLLPRSGTGVKTLLELGNTCGVIDADYRGEWKAAIRTKDDQPLSWEVGDELLQFLIVPVTAPILELVECLDETARSSGGFGHTDSH